MNTDEENALAERVIGAILEVSNAAGAGFLEKLCQRAWLRELGLRGSCRRICLLVNFQRSKAEWQRIVQGYPTPGVVEPPLS